jgi:hypothetical protein
MILIFGPIYPGGILSRNGWCGLSHQRTLIASVNAKKQVTHKITWLEVKTV